jgi:hypothetical protein
MSRWLCLLVLVSACRKAVVDSEPIDADSDGFTSEEDCNDGDAEVNADAEERCDGIDNDCSGEVDDVTDGSVFYVDLDADGYGDDTRSVQACDAPEGYAAVGGDCDDLSREAFPGAPETDCTDPRDLNCDGSVGFADADGDGFAACQDCNDNASAIRPDADETCDGVDNDCDTAIDEPSASDALTWYADDDGDDFGDATDTFRGCDAPEGYVANNTDCNDASDQAYPGLAEVCDGIDNDCDADRDETDAVDAVAAFPDADGDGYGNEGLFLFTCDVPIGFTLFGGDCDDTLSSVNPDEEEICDDRDNNCDGDVDEDLDLTWFADADRDGFGNEALSVVTCEVPIGFSLVGGDCDDNRGDVNPDQTEICDDRDNNCDGDVDEDFDLTWFADADRDGFGIAALTLQACEPGSGWSRTDGDCDDRLDTVNPSAIEVCDGVDNNCLGNVDEGFDVDDDGVTTCGGDCDDNDPRRFPGNTEECDNLDRDCLAGSYNVPEEDQPRWYVDADLDGFGSASVPPTSSCLSPDGAVDRAGDCDDDADDVYDGAPIGCDGVDYNCDGLIDNDEDADGFSDLICGGLDCDDSDELVYPGEPGCALDQSCKTILDNGLATDNDFYEIDPDGSVGPDAPFTVWCDMSGGGFTRPSPGERFRIDLTGQPFELPVPADASAVFQFEMYGASGGTGRSSQGGAGGRAVGSVQVEPGDLLTVFVGGQGAGGGGADDGPCFTRAGGYNGGGRGSQGGSGGGGATDVRLGGVALSDRVLVAGGGGGCGSSTCTDAGGGGGGTNGANGEGGRPGLGGTQNQGGAGNNSGTFGLGGAAQTCNDNGGGGGGWYGGGAGVTSNEAAGGGSGHLALVVENGVLSLSTHTGNGWLEYIYQ